MPPPITYYTWILSEPRNREPATESSRVVGDHSESCIPDSKYERASDADFEDGGPFRSVVKLLMEYEGGEGCWGMGTGYLISNDTLITAGHCVYDPEHGAVVRMKCYIGYSGREPLDQQGAQYRHAVKIVTPVSWVHGFNKSRDVAVVKLSEPFTERFQGSLKLLKFKDTPETFTANTELFVVGYPGEGPTTDGNAVRGARMYIGKLCPNSVTRINRKMLQYQITTYGGQSGAPVLLREWDTDKGERCYNVIGTHCYGGGGNQWNSASAIGTAYQNNYAFLKESLRGGVSEMGDLPSYLSRGSRSRYAHNQENSLGTSEDIMTGIGSIVDDPKPGDSLLKGPHGKYLSPICGIVLGELDRVLSRDNENQTSFTSVPDLLKRAVLAEAALRAIFRIKEPKPRSDIQDAVINSYLKVGLIHETKELVPRMLPIIYHSGFNILSGERMKTTEDTDAQDFIALAASNGNLSMSSKPESLFATMLPRIARSALAAVPRIFRAASGALANVDRCLANLQAPESASLSSSLETIIDPKDHKVAELLILRAIMAECALQVLLDWNGKHDLGMLNNINGGSFFQSLLDEVKGVGPVVNRVAPAVLKTMPLFLRRPYIDGPISTNLPN